MRPAGEAGAPGNFGVTLQRGRHPRTGLDGAKERRKEERPGVCALLSLFTTLKTCRQSRCACPVSRQVCYFGSKPHFSSNPDAPPSLGGELGGGDAHDLGEATWKLSSLRGNGRSGDTGTRLCWWWCPGGCPLPRPLTPLAAWTPGHTLFLPSSS